MSSIISIGSLIDHSWDRFRASVPDYVSLASVMLIVALIQLIALILFPFASELQSANPMNGWETFGVILYAIGGIIAPFLGFAIYVGVVRLTNRTSMQPFSLKEAFKEIKTYFVPSFVSAILLGLLIVAAFAIGLIPSFLFVFLSPFIPFPIVLALMDLLLIALILASYVFVVKWSVEYYFAPYSAILDKKKGKEALRHSRSLVRGKFWSVFLRLIVPKLVFIMFAVLALTVLYYVALLFINIFAGLSVDLRVRLFSIVKTISPVVVGIFISPLLFIADVMLYKSISER